MALTQVGQVLGAGWLYGTEECAEKKAMAKPAAGSEQAWSEPAQLPALCTMLCSADTSAESFQCAADCFYFLWFVFSKVGNSWESWGLTSKVQVIIIFMVACRSGWGKRTLPSSLQHFFLKNTGVTILQLNVSLCTCRFQIQHSTKVCQSQQLLFSNINVSFPFSIKDRLCYVWSIQILLFPNGDNSLDARDLLLSWLFSIRLVPRWC